MGLFLGVFKESLEMLQETDSTTEYTAQPGTELVQTVAPSDSGNRPTNSNSSATNLSIVIGIGSMIVCILFMIILYTLLKYFRGACTSTVDDNTEVSGDVYMEITDNMIIGQAEGYREGSIVEDLGVPVTEQPGSSKCNNSLPSEVDSVEEAVTDYIYSKVNKKQLLELKCDYKPLESEGPEVNLVDGHVTDNDTSSIQEMSDENDFHYSTPHGQNVHVDEEEKSQEQLLAMSNEDCPIKEGCLEVESFFQNKMVKTSNNGQSRNSNRNYKSEK
jgi:hypothetical protein